MSKQQAFSAYPKAKKQVNFRGKVLEIQQNLHYPRNQKNYFEFFTRNCEGIVNAFCKLL